MDQLQQIAGPQIKPILASRDFWTSYTLHRGLQTAKIYSKSLRSMTIIQAELEEENQEVSRKRALKALRSNKHLNLLHFIEDFEGTTMVQALAEMLRRFNHIQTFKLTYNQISYNQEAQKFPNFLKYLKDIHTLHVELDFGSTNKRISLKNLKRLTLQLSNLKQLVLLNLRLSNHEKIDAQDLDSFSNNLKKCQHLQSLALEFWGFGQIKNQAALCLVSCIHSLQALSSLALNLHDDFEIDSISMDLLFKALRAHSSLKSLRFSLPNYEYIGEEIAFLSQEFIDFHPLLSLKLHVRNHQENLGQDFFECLSIALLTQHELRVLSISLKLTETQGQWIKYLVGGFEGLKSLSKFFFTSRNSHGLHDNVAGDLGEAISKLKSLSNLELDLYGNNFSQEGIRKLLEGIQTLKDIRELYLNLDNHLSRSFLFPKVKSLLPFYKSQEIKTLNSALNNLQNLRTFRLDFLLFNFAAQDLCQFSEHLASMKQLKTLSLNFYKVNSSKALQKGLQEIFSSFKHLEKLVDLTVSVHCGSDQDLQSLFICFKDLRNLKSLEINFLDLTGFTFKTAYQFIEAMESLQKLAELKFSIDFPRSVVKEVQLFLTGISKLKSLTVLYDHLGRIGEVLPQTTTLEVCKYMKNIKCF